MTNIFFDVDNYLKKYFLTLFLNFVETILKYFGPIRYR